MAVHDAALGQDGDGDRVRRRDDLSRQLDRHVNHTLDENNEN